MRDSVLSSGLHFNCGDRKPKTGRSCSLCAAMEDRRDGRRNDAPGFRKKYRKVEITVKVKPSVKKICEKCKIIKRHGHVMVICENPKHKQRQG